MGYIKINFGGVERGLKFNQMTLHVMQKYTEKNAEYISNSYALIYAGLYCNAYQKREELDLTFEQVCDISDTLNEDQVLQIQKAFESTFTFDRKEETKEVKKNKMKVST